MLIVGSTALKKIIPDSREPHDLDIVVPQDKIEEVATQYGKITSSGDYYYTVRDQDKVIELLIAEPGNAMWMYLERYNAFEGEHYIDLAGLYSLKKSHIHFPLHFNKHIRDYCFLHQEMKGVDQMPEITKKNKEDIQERLGKRVISPSLKKSVKDFFGQSDGMVLSWFVHDDIHKVMAHKDKPMYEYMQKDLEQAWCSRDLWDNFSFAEKCRCVLEEAYVIALERKIIPILYGGENNNGYFSPKGALVWSMSRVCTNLTSGWFRKFATDNYTSIMDQYADKNYATKFLTAVDTGKIKFKKLEKELL